MVDKQHMSSVCLDFFFFRKKKKGEREKEKGQRKQGGNNDSCNLSQAGLLPPTGCRHDAWHIVGLS